MTERRWLQCPQEPETNMESLNVGRKSDTSEGIFGTIVKHFSNILATQKFPAAHMAVKT